MYRVIGIKRLVTTYAAIAILTLVLILILESSSASIALSQRSHLSLFSYLWGLGGKALSISALIFWIFGETALFPVLCKRPGVRNLLPDLDGTWVGEAKSNWPLVSARAGCATVGEPDAMRETIAVKVTIKARLLSVTMHLESDSLYSTSDTLMVGVDKASGNGAVQMQYVYSNRTSNAVHSDNSNHLGAAVLVLRTFGDKEELQGEYWTNRNWNRGLNTAGTLTLRRPSAV